MDEDEETRLNKNNSVENYTGVAIKVRIVTVFGPLILYSADVFLSGRFRSTLKSTKGYGFSNSLGAKSPSLRLPQVRVRPAPRAPG